MVQMVEIPRKLLKRIAETERAFRVFSGDLEDFLLAKDPSFLKKMRASRKAHRLGKTRSLGTFLAATV